LAPTPAARARLVRQDCARFLGLSAKTWRQGCTAAWAITVAVCCARPLLSDRGSSVYPIFATAARSWVAAADLYLPTDELYRYSPGIAALFVPLAQLPDSVGGCLWRVVNVAALLAALHWFMRACLPGRLRPPWAAVYVLLVLPLSVSNIHNGQSNPLLCGLLLGSAAAVSGRRWN